MRERPASILQFHCIFATWCPSLNSTLDVYKTSKTSNNCIRSRNMCSEKSAREDVGCGGNEDVEMDMWSHKAGQNLERNSFRGKQMLCGWKSDVDGCSEEENKGKTKAEVDVQHRRWLEWEITMRWREPTMGCLKVTDWHDINPT